MFFRRLFRLTGTSIQLEQKVLDWTIPREWRVNRAFIVGPDGKKFCDVESNNLHLVNYSIPFQGTLSREELDTYLHSIPQMPAAIPYITSYYNAKWGFCLSHEMREQLPDGHYQVVCDTELFDGSMTLGDCVLPGKSSKEILFHSYTCHPSLAINELSGPLVTAFVARELSRRERRFTYRIVLAPETIGAVAYLSTNGGHLQEKLAAGYVLTCVGDDGPLNYKRSKMGSSLADRAMQYVIEKSALTDDKRVIPFSPSGSDERQYCSLGFDFPVGSFSRTKYGQYDEYHTSFDNKSLLDFDAISSTVDLVVEVCDALEMNRVYQNRCVHGEPRLSKWIDFYGTGGRHRDGTEITMAAKWCVHYCDGKRDLLEIAEMSGLPLSVLADAASQLADSGLFKEIADE